MRIGIVQGEANAFMVNYLEILFKESFMISKSAGECYSNKLFLLLSPIITALESYKKKEAIGIKSGRMLFFLIP